MKVLAAALALALAGTSLAAVETPAQKDARMKWWREARFGMFIHWGLYAIPAGEWNGATGHGEWIRDTAKIPVDVYEQFLPQFNPVKFDARQWAKMAKDAGMKYVVLTSKHHDGFALFDSKVSEWDVMASPFKRDILKELSGALRAEGLKVGWYHSIMDWHHPDYLPRRGWEAATRPAAGANYDRFVQYLRSQVTEVMTQYGKPDIMWFDGEWESTWSEKYGRPLYDLCRTLVPSVIVNNRVSPGRGGMEDSGGGQVGDYGTPEQFIPATGLPGQDWETCMTMNDHWGWNKNDKNWKSTETLIRNLVDIASKGGNYLLNIGPKADGTFPEESIQRLKELGAYMKVNGEAIYGTQASPFSTLKWGRATTKANKLFLHVFERPSDGRLVVPGLGTDPVSARLLGGAQKLKTGRVGADVVVVLPAWNKTPSRTVALEFAGSPVVYRSATISAPSQMILAPTRVTMDGGKGVELRYTLDGSDPTTKSAKYAQPILLTKAARVRVAPFARGRRVAPISEMRFRDATPRLAEPTLATPGLTVREWAMGVDKLPNLATLGAPSRVTVGVPKFAESAENIVREYVGQIVVPQTGVYRIALTSDDGSKLWIGSELLIENDGLHAAETKSVDIALAKGAHPVRIGWFNRTGGAALALAMGPVGEKPKEVTLETLRTSGK